MALRLHRDVPPGTARDADLLECIEGWFPVIELHNHVFRAAKPTSQELVAGNAMHAGLVAAFSAWHPAGAETLLPPEKWWGAEIQVAIDGESTAPKPVGEVRNGPLGSLRWLVSALAMTDENLRAGDLALIGSPGQLIPVPADSVVTVTCAGQCVALFVETAGS